MGKRIVHCGVGRAAKICNNMILGISMADVCEDFVLAERLVSIITRCSMLPLHHRANAGLLAPIVLCRGLSRALRPIPYTSSAFRLGSC